MKTEFKAGDKVSFLWGTAKVYCTVLELYGEGIRARALLELTPEVSGEVVDERTTVALPLEEVMP